MRSPTSMGFFTRAALAAAHYVIMPVEPNAFADLGLNELLTTTETMGALMGTAPQILGCLVTQWKEDKQNQQLLAPVETELAAKGIPLIAPRIPVDKNIDKAHLETA